MTSSKAYLLRALNELILDNSCTPYIVVDATVESVQVPQEYVQDGQIVLNINPSSVRHLLMDNDGVSFDARFNGKSQNIYAPIQAVNAIYAKENGRGMVFGDEPEQPDPDGPDGVKTASRPDSSPEGNGDKSSSARPKLKVIK